MRKYRFTKLQLNWLADLRSGKFKKLKKYLAAINSKEVVYACCCLGTACETIRKVKPSLFDVSKESDEEPNRTLLSYNQNECVLPSEAIELLKLRNEEGKLKQRMQYKDRPYDSLIEMNDGNMTHKEIADYIERNPWNVFAK